MKNILITGSTDGLGKEIGIELLKQNNNVIFNYNNDDKKANELYNNIVKISNNFNIIKFDLSNVIKLNKLINKLQNIDILILNVGYNDRKNIFNADIFNIQKTLNINIISPILLIKELLINNKLNNSQILFIGSILGVTNDSKSISYTFTKGALYNITKYLAQELVKYNIKVNLINPGFFKSSWHKDKTKKDIDKIIKKIPLKRMAETKEISDFCISILKNKYITGSVFNIDGGYSLRIP